MFRGRPASGPGEPLWTDQDRGEALALVILEWDTCPGCGQSLQESTDPDAEGQYTVHELMCAGCQVREVVAEKKDSHCRGRKLRVVRK